MQRYLGRFWFVTFLFVIVLFSITARLVYLTTFRKQFLVDQSSSRIIKKMRKHFQRGAILDRNGNPLAISQTRASIWVNPQLFLPTDSKLNNLSQILDLSVGHLKGKIQSNKSFVFLKRHLTDIEFEKINEEKIDGLNVIQEYSRYYPAGVSASQLVGKVNVDGSGQEGIELAFDSRLHSVDEQYNAVVDRFGRELSRLETVSNGKKGEDVRLTIDRELQFIVFHYLEEVVRKHHAESGSVMVVHVPDGEILAAANVPSFDPNIKLQSTKNIRNRLFTDIFEPGSTVKAVTMAALLEYGFPVTTTVNTNPGYLILNDQKVKDVSAPQILTLEGIMKKSSNVGISKLALQLSEGNLEKTFHRFGLDEPVFTGFPGETSGRLNAKKNKNDFEKASQSFGYGFTVSLPQLVRAYSIIANKGKEVDLTLISRPKDSRKKEQIITESQAQQLQKMLKSVTQKNGTGKRANVVGMTVAGKTGTTVVASQGSYVNRQYDASFVGFAPAENPEYVIAVLIRKPTENGYYGGLVAAPLFAKVLPHVSRLVHFASNKDVQS